MKVLIVLALALSIRLFLNMRNSKKEKARKEIYSHGERDDSLDTFVVKTKAAEDQPKRAK